MGVIFFCFAGLIRLAYETYDTVTGAMILEEFVEKVRFNRNADIEVKELEQQAEQIGNPRLWLGEYQIELDMDKQTASGTASAGDWKQEIEMGVFMPGQFLRQYEAVKGMGEKSENYGSGNDGSGIPAGNESELYGNTSGIGTQ